MIQKHLLDRILRKIHTGGIKIIFWDGESRNYGPDKQPLICVVISSPKVINRIIRNFSLGVGESYMNNQLLVRGPLEQLIELAHRNYDVLPILKHNNVSAIVSKFQRSDDKKHIQHHYDIGNDFFKSWLDKSMNYSCAYFKKPNDSLETAQLQKNSYIMSKLMLQESDSVLDIGCGWGSFLIGAAKQYKIRGLGITLSKEQLRYASVQARKAGVSDLVKFRLLNYKEIPKLSRKFDKIACVEFIEAVGKNNLDVFFKIINANLKQEGIVLLQATTSQIERPPDAWICKYIFPGSYIPSVRMITQMLPKYELVMQDYENLDRHYIKTLIEWQERYELNSGQIKKLHGDQFYLMWQFWLASSISAFKTGHFELSQWIITKGMTPNLPLTREYQYRSSD